MRVIILGLIAIAIMAGLYLAGGSNNHTSASKSIAFADVQANVAKGARLYDVRTAEEYKAGHFSGSVNWPLQTMQAGTLPDVDKTAQIYLYCHSGNRASQAAVILKNAGYTNVTNLGGLAAVETIGGKLTTN